MGRKVVQKRSWHIDAAVRYFVALAVAITLYISNSVMQWTVGVTAWLETVQEDHIKIIQLEHSFEKLKRQMEKRNE